MELKFTTLDVFTDTPFKGNPLAVVTIPPALSSVLSPAQKQAIAKEFNLSETVFIHDVEDSSSIDRRIDIFTPTSELPFAGHPTIGTAIFLQSQGVKTLLAKAGPVAIQPTGPGSVQVAVPFNIRLHQKRVKDLAPNQFSPARDELARADLNAPVFSIVKGMTFVLVELQSLESLASAQIGIPGALPVEMLDAGWRDGWATRRYYYVKLGSERDSRGRVVHKMRTRMIKPTWEDPATGSAACALTSYLTLHELTEEHTHFELIQGVEIGRESTIHIDAQVEQGPDGGRKLRALHLGGKAVEMLKGVVPVPSNPQDLKSRL
ncbi:Fc.00g084620.m01.CDS01 [Cosmosporella sp. VM-42]